MMLAASDPVALIRQTAERAQAQAALLRPAPSRTPLYILGGAVAVGAAVLFLRRRKRA